MKYIFLLFITIILFSCKDPLPPRIDPYDILRSSWAFIPQHLKSDTLITSTDPSIFVNPISITPYIINAYDETIEDTSYINIKIKITLLNAPEISQEFTIRDTTAYRRILIRGDSLWQTLVWSQRLQGKRVYQHLPSPQPNPAKNRMEYELARIRLEGSIQMLKNVLPKALPPREILIFYWFKMT